MSSAANLDVDSVRIAMHNVTDTTFGAFHCLGQMSLEFSKKAYTFEVVMHGKPDAWGSPRALRTQLYFDSSGDMQDFLSGMKNQIDELRSKLYASMEKNNDTLEEQSVDTP